MIVKPGVAESTQCDSNTGLTEQLLAILLLEMRGLLETTHQVELLIEAMAKEHNVNIAA